jgi:hypothetical protein
MKTIQEIKTIISSSGDDPTRLYLLEKISDSAGLFLFDKKIAFAQKTNSAGGVAVSTNFVEFQPSILVKSVVNDPSFESGRFDFLILKSMDSDELTNSFIDLTSLYGQHPTMPFDSFISSIVELFQLPKKQIELDCIGLYGELSFIYAAWKLGIDISVYWHLNGVFSKYDFSSKKVNVEVKTSTSDSNTFLIKHSQIFNGSNNVVALVSLRDEEAMGRSLKDIVAFFQNTAPFCDNVAFQISLRKELMKKIGNEVFEKRFSVSGIYGFKSDWLQTIANIPECISDISYKYTFDVKGSLPVSIIIGLF